MIKGCISSRCKVISDKIEKVETHLHESTLCPSHYDVDVRLLSLHNGDDDDGDHYDDDDGDDDDDDDNDYDDGGDDDDDEDDGDDNAPPASDTAALNS